MHKVEVNLVSPEYLKPPREMIEILQAGGVVVKEFNASYFEQSDNGRIIAGALLHLAIKG